MGGGGGGGVYNFALEYGYRCDVHNFSALQYEFSDIACIALWFLQSFSFAVQTSCTNRMAQEPNWNRKPELSEPFSQKPKAEPEPPEPFFRNRNRNRPFLLNCTETQKTFFVEEPPEPKTGTARTVPPPNRNRTEPNRGLPAQSRKT